MDAHARLIPVNNYFSYKGVWLTYVILIYLVHLVLLSIPHISVGIFRLPLFAPLSSSLLLFSLTSILLCVIFYLHLKYASFLLEHLKEGTGNIFPRSGKIMQNESKIAIARVPSLNTL